MFNAIIKRLMRLEENREETQKRIDDMEEWRDEHAEKVEELMRRYNN